MTTTHTTDHAPQLNADTATSKKHTEPCKTARMADKYGDGYAQYCHICGYTEGHKRDCTYE